MAQEIQNIIYKQCGCHGPTRKVTDFTVSDKVNKIADGVISDLKFKNVINESVTIALAFGIPILFYIPVIPVAIGLLGIGFFINNMSYSCLITSKLAIFLVNERLQQNPDETRENLVKYVENEWYRYFNYQCNSCEFGES